MPLLPVKQKERALQNPELALTEIVTFKQLDIALLHYFDYLVHLIKLQKPGWRY